MSGFCLSAEHEAAIGLAFGKVDVSFEDEVFVGFVSDDEEFLFSGEVDLAVDNLHVAPFVGIAPTFDGFSVEERDEAAVLWLVLSEERAGEGKAGEKKCFESHTGGIMWAGFGGDKSF